MWAVHGVIVMLEWCYTIDLLDSSALSGFGRGLREIQATFTQPWLRLVAVASVLALYHGIVQRRVAETLGQALLMLAMMVGGIWVIMNPAGTVGSLDQWANEAEPRTLGSVRGRDPGSSGPNAGRQHERGLQRRGGRRPGATWSSEASDGATIPLGWTHGCGLRVWPTR